MAELQLPPGLVRSNSPYATSDRWYDANLIRWQSGAMLPMGGWQRHTSSPLDSPARAIKVWRDNTVARQTLICTDTRLYVDSSGAYVNITPVGFAGPGTISGSGGYGTFTYGASTYGTGRPVPSPIYSPYGYPSFAPWGEDMICTANTDGRLFYYTARPGGSAPTLLTATAGTVPTGVNAVLATPERHVMVIAMNGDPRSVGWSSQNTSTDWNFSSVSNSAGTLPLVTRTPLLKGWNVAEGVLVMSYTDVFLLRYAGLPYIYVGQTPISDTSLFNPLSVVTFGGKAMWPSRMGFQMYNGGFVGVVPCPMLEEIFSGVDATKRMDPTYGPFRMHGAYNFRYDECWWFYPSVGQRECDRYVVFNPTEGWWSWGALSRSAMSPADAYQYPYMGGTDSHVYEHENGFLANGASLVGQVWAETGALSAFGGERVTDVSQMLVATGAGPGVVDVSAYCRMAPEGPEIVAGPFAQRADGYTDSRFSARHARLRYTLARDGTFAVASKVMLDAKPGGRR
jgi:hypothetical protein